MRGRWLASLIVFTVATGVSSAWAAPPDTSVVLGGGTAARTLNFDNRDEKGIAATLTLVVKLPRKEIGNRTAQSRISFLPLAAGTRGELVFAGPEPSGAYPSDEPALFTPDGNQPTLHSGQNVIRLTFGLAEDAALTVADGLLRVRLPDRELIGLDVETKATSPKLTIEPSTVKLQVTEGLPLFGEPKLSDPTGTSEVVALSGPPTAAGDAVEGTLHAANDATAKATLALSQEIDEGGTVTVRDWTGTESFSGNLVLDPESAAPTTLAIELNVRDSIWLPIGAVFLGAVLGNLLLPRYRRWRRQRILRTALEDAIAAYQAQDPEGQDFFFNLDLVLGPKGSRTLAAGACAGSPVGRVPLIALLCDIDSAKTEGEFQEVTARTRALLAEITQWHEFRHAIVSLVAAYARADPPAGMLLEHDVEHALFDVQAPPPKATTQAVLDRLRGQAQLVDAYALLKGRIAALHADPEASDEVLAKLPAYEPNALYARARGPDGASTPPKPVDTVAVWRILNVFNTARRALDEPESAPDEPRVPEPTASAPQAPAAAPQLVPVTAAGDDDGGVAARLVVALPAPAAPAPDRRIMARIWWMDLAISLVTATLVAVVYVLTIYDATYGGWEDLLSAFAAGFAGDAVVKGIGGAFAGLPEFQAYRPEPAAAK